MKRRTVQKITPAKHASFDQQFWPVVVALTVLSGIAIGAVLTILNGPWMWASLFVLPMLAAGAIFLLFNLDNSTLRRSLQFAIIVSMALHLCLLVFASVINIFQNPFKPNERPVAQHRVRTIEISDQRASFVWEETNTRETPEPELETQREDQPSTNLKPQPIPVPEIKPQPNPHLVRREKPVESIPRQNRELSELRRSTRKLQPQSSEQMTGEKVVTQPVAQPASKEKVESSQQANQLQRPASSQPETEPVVKNEPQSEPAQASPAPTDTQQEIARTSSKPQRSMPAELMVESAAQPSPSTARVRRRTPSLPTASQPATPSEKIANASTKDPSESTPSQAAEQLTRRPTQRSTVNPAMTNRATTELSPRVQPVRSSERRPENKVLPSISSETSITMTPRRATVESNLAASPVPIEQPSRAPESNSSSRELNSKTLSVSRSTAGITGVGKAKNLDRYVGGITSTATRASDSAQRERTQSSPKLTRMLTSSMKSESRRSSGATPVPTSAFKADTSSAAKIAGSRTPSQQSLESSAASVDSASTSNRDEVSAERGEATIDLGPTKIVMDRETRRRSGGGQPDVSRLDPDATRRSKDRSQHSPSLVAASGLDVAAQRNPSTSPAADETLDPSSQSSIAAREGGESAVTAERWSAANVGEISDRGESGLAQRALDNRTRANREVDESSWDLQEDAQDGENRRGTNRERIARAPVINSDPGFGIANSEGRADVKTSDLGDAISESSATRLTRQSTASIPGSGVGRTATNALIQAAASRPIVDPAPSRNRGRGTSQDADQGLAEGIAAAVNPRSARTSNPTVAPTVSPGDENSIAAAVSQATTGTELESTPVELDRTMAAREQIQGQETLVDAIEGPAGLGDRPDNYVGIMTRPSSRDSEQLQPDLTSRFRRTDFGGTPAVNPDAVIARDAFRKRTPAAVANAAEPMTEAAIHLGLEFLARYQSPDGSWSLSGFDREAPQQISQLDSDTAATGLALLAFQGAGYNHREFKYARQIDRAIQWLIENQSKDGGLYVPSDKKSDDACRLYSHGIAALALTEAYGMTQDSRLREPAQKALDYIAESQDPRKGGWRYFDEPGRKSSDTSVSGWMMMAMQSGRLAGLDVDDKSFESVDQWLEVAADPENSGLYRYNPYAVDSKGVSRIQGRRPTPSMTSVGLLMRIYSGWDRHDERLLAGADYLIQNQLPNDSTPLQRDTYYWYYATQVLKHIDGPRWKTWDARLRPLLTRSQEKIGDMAGSWHPYKPVPDRWGAFGGRIYVTTMNLLSLEVRHRMLPLYKQNQPPEIVGYIENDADPSMSDAESGTGSESGKGRVASEVPTPQLTPPAVPTLNRLPEGEAEMAESNAADPKLELADKASIPPQMEDLPPPPELESDPELDNANLAAIEKPEKFRILNVTATIEPTPELAELPGGETEFGRRPRTTPLPKVANSSLPPAEPMPTPPPSRSVAKQPATKQPATKQPATKQPTTRQPADPVPSDPSAAGASKPAPYVAVAGRIFLDGKLLTNTKIELTPIDIDDAEPVSARTNQNGQFKFDVGTTEKPGPRAGSYQIAITSYFESPDENVIDLLEQVPAKYNSKSKLKVTLSADKQNSFDIKLVTEK